MSRYYTRAELDNSPSRREGMDAKKETQFRWAACELIKDTGMRLKVYARGARAAALSSASGLSLSLCSRAFDGAQAAADDCDGHGVLPPLLRAEQPHEGRERLAPSERGVPLSGGQG